MEQSTSISGDKPKVFHIPNLIAAFPPFLLFLGACLFPIISVESLDAYLSDFIPSWYFALAFLPAVVIYTLGIKKRYVFLSYLVAIITMVFLVHKASLDFDNSLLGQHIKNNAEYKFDKYKQETGDSVSIDPMIVESPGYGLYIFCLGLLLLPISLFSPKYKRNNGFLSLNGLNKSHEGGERKGSLSIKSWNIKYVFLTGGIVMVATVLYVMRPPTPSADILSEFLVDYYKDNGYKLNIKDLDIYGCEQLDSGDMMCLVDLAADIDDKYGFHVSSSNVEEEETRFSFTNGKYRAKRPMTVLSPKFHNEWYHHMTENQSNQSRYRQ
ncbi:hypothetical protein [Pseudoalteromonas luteoviolacea]|uniref:Uncharacterized protein n=1 Tax=Pseudoalteromonas luteoviolacea H33 TaxID=1365251 RepID=A0A167DZL6_9GAMM|nr:hypothetical protein [Pseudoalteromonas luteoviolacea]KZN49802.1 hypothetical protein N476_18590 [Pseudoalteromonas luteoviolacea H33]KZN77826.1 hypothetical protein N477_01045 [Pseudoalteromonas luteoviolacea H33-S]MBQ4879467.1 hypothetical protein [Pseudoalteromonas luteoviolacea]MBQ4908527.1 hypothetical protein [Pseudoalteromonas luteoviolacea]